MAKSYLKAAIPASIGTAVLPYLVMKKKDNETQRAFEARRRGMMAAVGATAGIAAGHYVPPALIKSAENPISEYLRKARLRAEIDAKAERDKRVAGMSKEELAREAERIRDAKDRRKEGFTGGTLLGRGANVALGASLLTKNVPQLAGARGRQMLYHGTGANAIQGILGDGDKTGLRLEFAGTKGRLNAALMPNAVVRDVLEAQFGGSLRPADLVSMQNRVVSALKMNKDQGRPVLTVIGEEIDKFKEGFGFTPEQIKQLKATMKSSLSQAGLRTYFATSPAKVHTWADDANEADKIKSNLMGGLMENMTEEGTSKAKKRALLSNLLIPLEVATGGLRGEFKDIKQTNDYLESLNVHGEKVSPEFIRNLARKMHDESGGKASFVLGANVPTHDVQMLADFKGVSAPLRLVPALQGLLSNIPGFEGYNPNNDISTAADVDMSNIKHVDMRDADGKVTRYMLDSYKPTKLTAGQRINSLRRAALPAALVGMGADAIYRGVSGRRGILGTAVAKYREREEGQQRKTAAAKGKKFRPYLQTAKDMAQYGVPVLGLGLASSALEDKIGRTIVPVSEAEYNPTSARDNAEGVVRETMRGAAGTGLRVAMAAGLATPSAALGSRLGTKYVKKHLAELIDAGNTNPMAKAVADKALRVGKYGGGAAGVYLPAIGTLGAAFASKKYKESARGQDTLRAELGTSPEEQMRTPWKSAIVPAAATLLGVGAAVGQVRRRFPGLIAAEKRKFALGPLGQILTPGYHADALEQAAADIKSGRGYDDQILNVMRDVNPEILDNFMPRGTKLRDRVDAATDTFYEHLPADVEMYNADIYAAHKHGERVLSELATAKDRVGATFAERKAQLPYPNLQAVRSAVDAGEITAAAAGKHYDELRKLDDEMENMLRTESERVVSAAPERVQKMLERVDYRGLPLTDTLTSRMNRQRAGYTDADGNFI